MSLSVTPDSALPESLDDPRVGIANPALARVVASVFTRCIADNHDASGGNHWQLLSALADYSRAEAGRNSERALPDCAQVRAGLARESGPTTRALELTHEDLRSELKRREAESGADAAFDVNLLCRYVPPEVWAVAAAFINDGPAIATQRAERCLEDYATGEVQATRRQQAGKRSRDAVKARGRAFRRLMNLCTELRWAHSDAVVLEDWTGLPPMAMPEGSPTAPKDTIAPPRHLLRATWQRLDSEVQGRLGVDSLEEEADAIRSASSKLLQGLFLRLRDRAMLALIAVVGTRRGATSELDRGDFVLDRQRADGRCGPAIRLVPGKSAGGREARWKPIPEELALAVESYLLFLERRLGCPLAADDPLWVATQQLPMQRVSPDAFTARFAGGGSKGGVRAIVRRNPQDPYDGYAPHLIRAASAQMILSYEGQDWLRQNRIDHPPISLAEALLDHEDMKLDEFGYHGAKKEHDRERLSAIGTELNWLLFTTDLGARKVKDGESYRELLRRRRAVEAEQRKWAQEKRRLRKKAAAAAERKDLEQVIFLNVEADAAGDSENEATLQLAELDGELKEIKLSDERLLCVPDDIPSEDLERVDLAEIEREVNEGLPSYRARRLKPVRTIVTLGEYGEIFGRGASTLRRWREQGTPTRVKPAPWKQELEPWVVFSAKRTAVHADAINPESIDTPEKRERLAEILASPLPDGWAGVNPMPELPPAGGTTPTRSK